MHSLESKSYFKKLKHSQPQNDNTENVTPRKIKRSQRFALSVTLSLHRFCPMYKNKCRQCVIIFFKNYIYCKTREIFKANVYIKKQMGEI